MTAIQYSKPPIVEAMLDIAVETKREVSAIDIAIKLGEIEGYSNRNEIPVEQRLQFQIGPDALPSLDISALIPGFHYISDDGKRVFEARPKNFIFHLLCNPAEPESRYISWSSFIEEARDKWSVYKAACDPAQVVGINLRYVNRFDFPFASVELKDFLNIYPQEPGMPQNDIVNFHFQLVMPQHDIEAVAVVNMGAFPSPPRGATPSTSIGLDVSLVEAGLSVLADDDDKVWTYVETLHVRKNEVFEACITDRTRELLR